MKKLFSILLIAALALSMSLSVFAGTIENLDVPAEETGNVNVTVTDTRRPEEIPVTYNVVVEWEDLNFTYTITGDWDPEAHKYEGDWNKTSANITVTNHSNADVKVDAELSGDVTKNSVTASLSNDSFTLDSAVGTTVENAPNQNITVNIDGNPDTTNTTFELATVTVTISKVD